MTALSKSTYLYTNYIFIHKYECLLFINNFNVGLKNTSLKKLCNSFNFMSLINKPTCFKKPEKPFYIQSILTNCPCSFQNSPTIETTLPDFHRRVV